jgi:hypothetical protein
MDMDHKSRGSLLMGCKLKILMLHGKVAITDSSHTVSNHSRLLSKRTILSQEDSCFHASLRDRMSRWS